MATKKESKNKTENKENIVSMSIACTQINLHLYDTDVNLSMYFKIICFSSFFPRPGACVCLCVRVGSDLPAQTKTVKEF